MLIECNVVVTKASWRHLLLLDLLKQSGLFGVEFDRWFGAVVSRATIKPGEVPAAPMTNLFPANIVG